MNPELQQIFDSTPEDEARSKLEPYRELILRWRRQGRTYRRICLLLNEKCNVTITGGALYRYVKRRSRPRKSAEQKLESVPSNSPVPAVTATEQPVAQHKRLTPGEKAVQVELIRSLRKKPVVVPEPSQPLFDYDPDKPLTIDRTRKD